MQTKWCFRMSCTEIWGILCIIYQFTCNIFAKNPRIPVIQWAKFPSQILKFRKITSFLTDNQLHSYNICSSCTGGGIFSLSLPWKPFSVVARAVRKCSSIQTKTLCTPHRSHSIDPSQLVYVEADGSAHPIRDECELNAIDAALVKVSPCTQSTYPPSTAHSRPLW